MRSSRFGVNYGDIRYLVRSANAGDHECRMALLKILGRDPNLATHPDVEQWAFIFLGLRQAARGDASRAG